MKLDIPLRLNAPDVTVFLGIEKERVLEIHEAITAFLIKINGTKVLKEDVFLEVASVADNNSELLYMSSAMFSYLGNAGVFKV